MAWAFSILPKIEGMDKIILLRLADRADPDGVCWPGHARTAADVGVSKRTVQRAVVSLEAAGFLRRQERPGRSCLLKLMVPTQGGDILSPLSNGMGGDRMSRVGCQRVTPGGDRMSPITTQVESVIKTTTTQPVVVVSEKAETQPETPGQRLSQILQISGAWAADLDAKSAGASRQQLDHLQAAFQAGVATGSIKDEGAWLIKMAAKAAAGLLTGQRVRGALAAQPVATTLAAELLASGIKNGSTIFCNQSSKKWGFDEFGGVRNSDGVLVGPAATRDLLARIAAGELQVSQ